MTSERPFDYGVAETMPSVVFVGSNVTFTEQLLNTATDEMQFVSVARMNRADLSSGDREGILFNAVVIVFEPTKDEDIAQSLEEFETLAPNASVVMSYRSERDVEGLLPELARGRTLETLSLLPMRMQIDSWLSVLRLLVSGERYLPSSLIRRSAVAAALESDVVPIGPNAVASNILTTRECQVLELVAQGKQNKIIANELDLSIHTVKLHLHKVIAKLEVRNRTEAALWYLNQPNRTE